MSISKFSASEPWPGDVQLFQPFEVEQVLLPDNASILAVQSFLNMANLEYMIEMRANAEHMSPSGKITRILFKRSEHYLFSIFQVDYHLFEPTNLSLRKWIQLWLLSTLK